MKKLSLALLLMLSFNAFAQVDQLPVIKSGFYVNYGTRKVEKLDCMGFDNLILAFEIKEELLTYEKYYIQIDFTGGKHTMNPIATEFNSYNTAYLSTSDLKDKYSYLLIFRDGVDYMQFYNAKLEKYDCKRYFKADDAKLQGTIVGVKQYGTKTVINSDGSISTYPTYTEKELYKTELLTLHSDAYTAAENTKKGSGRDIYYGNCYPYSGTKQIDKIPGFNE